MLRNLLVILLVALSIFVILAYIFLPVPQYGWSGSYNSWSGIIWCNDNYACYHEIGHKLDHDNGWISQKGEFEIAVKTLMITGFTNGNPSDMAMMIAVYPIDSNLYELYADIYTACRGNKNNMDISLQRFYDFEKGNIYIDKYNPYAH